MFLFRYANPFIVPGLNLNISKGLQNKFHLFFYTIHVEKEKHKDEMLDDNINSGVVKAS